MGRGVREVVGRGWKLPQNNTNTHVTIMISFEHRILPSHTSAAGESRGIGVASDTGATVNASTSTAGAGVTPSCEESTSTQ